MYFKSVFIKPNNFHINIYNINLSINERYTCGKIGAHGIQIRSEVGARVGFLETDD